MTTSTTNLYPQNISQLAADALNFARQSRMIAPVTLSDLQKMAKKFIKKYQHYAPFEKWVVLMLNNALWHGTVASIPFRRRILLVPQCLRKAETCPARIDAYGLLCEACGACKIHEILDKADELGMMCLVAEGSTMVADLIKNGEVDAIIGLSCFEALEKAFPKMIKYALPGLALPLYGNGCKDTSADFDYLYEMLSASSNNQLAMPDLKLLSDQVRSWFSLDSLAQIMGPALSRTDEIAREWLSGDGKRYRPFLCAAVAQSLGDIHIKQTTLQKLAVAVECFHKASLIHDDIEDDDQLRNGKPTLPAKYSMPIALNAGDQLLGEGYRLINEAGLSSADEAKLMQVAANGHLELCRGQGEELLYASAGTMPDKEETTRIFRRKTSPAFNVAFQFGAILMKAGGATRKLLERYSDNLGIAYQIADDLDDTDTKVDAHERSLSIVDVIRHETECCPCDAEKAARELFCNYRDNALASLKTMKTPALKRLLFQITPKILGDLE